MAMKNETLDAVLEELKQYGIASDVSHGSKHIQVRWTNRTRQIRYATVSRRASTEWHMIQNARRKVRQILRDDGMLPESDKAAAPAPRQASRIEQLENDLRLLNTRVARVEQLLKEHAA